MRVLISPPSLCFAGLATAETGRVVSVADGDTITVQTEDKRRIRIRLHGIDAPERTQAYSQVSRRHLHELVMGKVVTESPTPPWEFPLTGREEAPAGQ